MHVLSGSILTADFFSKNLHFILVLFLIITLYISNRYKCISKIAEIQTLQNQLKEAKYESLTISTELIGLGRQSKIKSLVEKNGLDLKFSKDQTYRIKE